MKENHVFKGIMSALVTPLDSAGRVHVPAVHELIEFQLAAGIDGFYLCGGTGEGVSLDAKNRMQLVETAVAANRGRGKIIVHTGAINPWDAFALAEHAKSCGADGVSSIPPSIYYSYTEADVVAYYRRLAESGGLPLLVYRPPSFSGDGIVRLIEKLMAVENIVGLKYTGSSYFEMWRLLQINDGNINVINGADETLLCGLVTGADGGIGAVYNVIPAEFTALYRAFRAGDLATAKKHQQRICRVIETLFRFIRGAGIILPLKALLKKQGIDAGMPVFPAQDYSEAELEELQTAFDAAMRD